jgi:hypothetical protein
LSRQEGLGFQLLSEAQGLIYTVMCNERQAQCVGHVSVCLFAHFKFAAPRQSLGKFYVKVCLLHQGPEPRPLVALQPFRLIARPIF